MKAEQVDQSLAQKFLVEEQRLVFWSDPKGQFTDYIADGLSDELKDVTVLDVIKHGGMSAKLLLEREDPVGKYLIYSTGDIPVPEEDWLLDLRIYSAEFYADVASIWLQELGLSGLYLRDHLKARAVFMGSQERRKKLKRLISADDDAAAIDLKMMAVLAGSEVPILFSILRAVCHGHLKDGHFSLGQQPKAIDLFEKMSLAAPFWDLVQNSFGYANESPSIAGLLRQLFVSELFNQMGETRIDSLAHFQLPPMGRQNAVVCLTQWRDSSGKSGSYDGVAEAVAKELKIDETLAEFSLGDLTEVFTFWEAEQRVVSQLKKRVLEEAASIDVDGILAIASERKAGHWLAGQDRDRPERRAVADAYDAIVAAAELFSLRIKYQQNLAFDSPEALLEAYRAELYRFDQLYRRFFVRAKTAQGQGWDLLKTLAEEVERVYDQAFLQPLGLEWSRLLDAGFLEDWQLDKMSGQQNFYADHIKTFLKENERSRAFVIISDAFRYEAAHELVNELNGEYRFNAELNGMLGVLPSYTALGMASLLPHEELSYSDKGMVLVDGQSSSGTEARNKQLAKVNGMACQAKELMAMKREDIRSHIHGKRVLYIYHDVIDSRSDGGSNENETFSAVADCINELKELVQLCVNTLNAGTVWVTADHGFLFQHEAPGITDKSKLTQKPEHALVSKKRYVIGKKLGNVAEAHQGYTHKTAGTGCDTEFWVPRGANRFHFTGGARFVHGGAMPQEVLVPLVKVTHVRGKSKEGTRSEKVAVQVLGGQHKITTAKYRFELIQTSAVGDRRKPVTVRAAVYDGARAVTSVETVTFDSTSDSLDERTKSILLELSTGDYDKSKEYRLVLRDIETDAEVLAIPVVIDRSFDDDF
ncbi:MAG: BREX-1 system phosphatase PglZ type A [Deltaproteobacteria bacterium]|nr:BREX-1 system phosphatase PglZ type A [Deltaproteobacteria bacterium]